MTTTCDDTVAAATRSGSRTGLVLGAGGVLGACWSIGALRALETVGQWDPRAGDVIVGTSSGAVISAMLACDIGVRDLDAGQRCPDEGVLAEGGFDCANPMVLRRPWGLPGLGSPRLLAQCLADPLGAPLMHWCTALAPCGRGSLAALRALVEHIAGGSEPATPVQLVATDYDSGRREVFHPVRDEDLPLPEAVAASCSVPGLFPPVTIAGRRFVDGVIGSSTNADLLVDAEVDNAVIIAPMAARSIDNPLSPLARAERFVRRRITAGLETEVAELREAGISTTVIAPTAEDLAVIGANAFDCSRRLSVLDTAMRTTSRQLEGSVLAHELD